MAQRDGCCASSQRLPPQPRIPGDGVGGGGRRCRVLYDNQWIILTRPRQPREIFSHRIIARLPTIASSGCAQAVRVEVVTKPFILPSVPATSLVHSAANVLHIIRRAVRAPTWLDAPIALRVRSSCGSSCNADHEHNASTLDSCASPVSNRRQSLPRRSRRRVVSRCRGRTLGRPRGVAGDARQIGSVNHIPKHLGHGQGQVEEALPPPWASVIAVQELRPARPDHPR